VNHLRDEYAACQTSHDNRRHQLDLHLVEIDDLHRALSDQADELHRAEAEKKRIAAEKSGVARTVAALEADLNQVRKDAEAFGRDLKLLRAEKEKLEMRQKEELSKVEKARRQSHGQIRLLTDQLETQRQKAMRAKEELENHVCVV
jgi:chromosome segregation ATPase